MHRHRDVEIRLRDVDEMQIELSIVRMISTDGRNILECHGWKDKIDVSWNDELNAVGVNDEITTFVVGKNE